MIRVDTLTALQNIWVQATKREENVVMAQLNIQVAVPHMGRIEDAHMIICHMIGYSFMDQPD